MYNAIEELDFQLDRALAKYPAGDPAAFLRMPAPTKLAAASQILTLKFVDGKPAEPPSQARINALARLRRNDPRLNRRDWNLIAWGLCDDCGRAGKPIDDADMIGRVIDYLANQASRQSVGRRFWFGLLHSYFAYASENPSSNENWTRLRAELATSALTLIASQQRPKAWAKVLEAHLDLLAQNAGERLADAIFHGDTSIVAELKTYLPIPDTSWLWQRIIAEQLLLLRRIPDEAFYPFIPTMLELAEKHPQQTDNILSALLTRYERSAARDKAHEGLKQLALAQWQNPQIKMANRWALVSEEVRKMVLQWFAMADLQHFFSLLQGAGGVDRDRLNYWLRFVDQIGYTRIILGGDAIENQHPNYVDFRVKNKGRYSALHGGDSANNAFIMRIGSYYFVEFSGKGNACYVYEEGRLPFDPASLSFRVLDLKRKLSATDRIIHNGYWQPGADGSLRRLGIYPNIKREMARNYNVAPKTIEPLPASLPEPANHRPVLHGETRVSPGQASQDGRASPFAALFTSSGADQVTSTSPPVAQVVSNETTAKNVKQPSGNLGKISAGEAIRLAMEMQQVLNVGFTDYRVHGGAFWVLEKNQESDLAKRLLELGFRYRAGRGHWMK